MSAGLGDGLRAGLAGTVPGPGLHAHEDRGLTLLRCLQGGTELERMAGHDPVVVVAGREHRRRVAAGPYVVQRRVPPQPPVLSRNVRVPVLGRPEPADGEPMEAQHVEDPDVRDGRPE